MNRRPGLFVYGLLTAFLLGSCAPLYWSFLVGSHSRDVLTKRVPPLIPGGHFWDNAQRAFDAVPFWKAMGNSLIVSGTVATSVVFFSTLAGFAFAKLAFKGRTPLLVFVVATLAVPTQLGIIPLFIVMAKLGWVGSLWALIVPGMVTAFGVFFMRIPLVPAPPAVVLVGGGGVGGGLVRTFCTGGAPAGGPPAGILWLFTFMATWTDFFWPLVVLPASNPTIQIALQQLQSGYYVDYSLVLAGATLSTVPLLVLFVLTGRQMVAGIMQGAVKG
ncbi:carbohydrate ABC transporter permease [Nocardioides sp.]|uniref:carbohydrate ABC transporter permease n=1 Tax=Nocardioides sp. TaxID=35761 RepID=UPI0035B1029F